MLWFQVRAGNHCVVEKGHTVVLGWNKQMPSLLRQVGGGGLGGFLKVWGGGLSLSCMLFAVTARTGRWFETLSAHACFLTPLCFGVIYDPFRH